MNPKGIVDWQRVMVSPLNFRWVPAALDLLANSVSVQSTVRSSKTTHHGAQGFASPDKDSCESCGGCEAHRVENKKCQSAYSALALLGG